MTEDAQLRKLYREAESLYRVLRAPASGLIGDATDINASALLNRATFSAVVADTLEGSPPTRIAEIDLTSGCTRILTYGPNSDRLPRYSPDGHRIAFLSDRHKAGDFQLYLLDRVTGGVCRTPAVEGWIEYLHWSADGERILLGVAGHGADISSGEGAVTTGKLDAPALSWMPAVDTGDESRHWRSAWVYELASDRAYRASPPEANIWEAVWCGPHAFAAVVSPGPREGLWYSAQVEIMRIGGGSRQKVHQPADQVGWPSASPEGTHLAFVEGVCSDRWIVAGSLRVLDTKTGIAQSIDTHGIDITHVEWHSERVVLAAGHRGFDTVIGTYDRESNVFNEVWTSRELSSGARYIALSGLATLGDCVLVGEGFLRAPEIGVIREGKYTCLKSFDTGYASQTQTIDEPECLSWRAPDGLEIQGWLLRPKGKPPFPLVLNIHGGPVSLWKPTWLGRVRHVPILMLLQHGFAVFLPNPRGSSGRGPAFARHVLGDMGGADTYDCLSGLDHLVAAGIADPRRLGVTGGSYGGYMSAWLITQDARFAAAVPVAPVTNKVSQHLISNIPDFVSLFLADRYDNPGGRYFQRSPIMYARNVRTPTLSICGALDRCTPPEEALQFHNALLECGVRSVLVTYPQEGHGIRKMPAAIDYAARAVAWFLEHMGPARHGTGGANESGQASGVAG